MLIQHHKAFFIHIPKTAGTSIKSTLGARKSGHFNAAKLKKAYPPQIWKEYYKFSFVRNPWDRVASMYHYYKSGKHNSPPITEALKHVSFEEFVQKLCSRFPYDWMTGVYAHPIWGQQVNWLKIDGSIAVDFIGRYENLEKDFAQICKNLKIKKRLKLNHLKNSGNIRYQSEYNNETKDLVAKKFIEDIKYFKYDF